MSIRCAKCNSERVVPRAAIWDRTDYNAGGKLYVYVYANPDALFFPGTTYATLSARVCGDCGYTEIYADGASELYEAYARSRSAAPEAPPESPPEPVAEEACLSCGKAIPHAAKACPACGWTWEEKR